MSEHFSLYELTFSETALRFGIDNEPNEQEKANLERLATEVLEPSRSLLGVPFHVNSGYRSLEVNRRVGGSQRPLSAHVYGRAADVVPIGVPLRRAFDEIRASNIPFDQLIIECDAWLHISIAPEGEPPRREVLIATGGPGHWRYEGV